MRRSILEWKLLNRKWVIFGLVCISYLLAFAQRTGPGLITDQLQAEFHVSAAVLGMMTSVQYLLYMILQVPVGLSGDKFGPERLLVAGVLFDGVGTIIFSRAESFPWLLLGRAVVGLGDALIWVNIVLILAERFLPQEFGALLGLVGTAGNVGALLTTLPFAAWISAAGWRSPFLTLGFVLVAVAACNWLAFSERGSPRWKQRTRPQTAEVASQPVHRVRNAKINPVPVRRILADVVRDRLAWATFGCHFGIVGTYMGFVSLWAVPVFMATHHVSRSGAAWFTLVAFVGALFGGPVTGAISDRMGSRRQPYIVLQVAVTISWIALWLAGTGLPAAVTYFLMIVIGFGNGGSLLTFAVIRDLTPAERSGVMSGFANTGGFLSAVLLPVCFGAVVDVMSPNAAHGVPASPQAMATALIVPAVFSLVGVAGAILLPERARLSEAGAA